MLNQENNTTRAIRFQRWLIHCFDTNLCLEKKMEQVNFGGWRGSSSQDSPNLCTLVNSIMDRSPAKRRRTQEKFSVLYWFDWTGNSLSPCYPRSFKRKSCGSVFTGQCIDPRQLLWVHFSCRMLLQCALYIEAGLIAGGKNASQDRQKVFSTAVHPLATHCHKQIEFDLSKLRVHQDAVYWIDIRLALKKGLMFFQTRSKRKHYVWSSDAEASSSSTQQIQSNQNDQLASSERPVTSQSCCEFDSENTSDVQCDQASTQSQDRVELDL